ncbi:hypothetical protein EK21DRAFT_108283 [Setomelanomma holmii]|uniref:Uncharacterized protein n=1 Tax=Setomelanomma holmii TaxID=210430 RepID=A0A9P4LSZ1_9PLEO|nr:hypothetical protein EK21DRAFT_108283 [Setomelanomma holmii]
MAWGIVDNEQITHETIYRSYTVGKYREENGEITKSNQKPSQRIDNEDRSPTPDFPALSPLINPVTPPDDPPDFPDKWNFEEDGVDSERQAYIYLAQKRRHPPADGQQDRRRYPDIVKDGLDGTHNILEEIEPLAQTVFHELTHAVGGMILPNPNNPNYKTKHRQRIDDRPTKDTYGWLKFNQRRAVGDSNIGIADCITFLAQVIYFQIQGKDTYWTTEEVDPATLRPKNLPKP